MALIKQTITVPYTDAQLYELVIDLEQYPDFLPWCKNVVVRSRSPTKIEATVSGEKMGISFSVNIAYLLRPNKLIDIRFLVGTSVFRNLQGYWRFDGTGNKTQFGFELEVEFLKAFLNWTIIPIIRNEAKNVIKAFAERAKKVYDNA